MDKPCDSMVYPVNQIVGFNWSPETIRSPASGGVRSGNFPVMTRAADHFCWPPTTDYIGWPLPPAPCGLHPDFRLCRRSQLVFSCAMVPPSPVPVSWFRCFSLRTAALYLLLWAFPFPLNVLPFFDWLETGHRHLMEAVGLFALRLTTGFAGPLTTVDNGSGDRLENWVGQLGVLLVSLAGGALWAAFGRTATRQARIGAACRLYLRYFLATAMLLYGVSKLTLNHVWAKAHFVKRC